MTSIILVSYNTLPLTRLCLESIREHTAEGSYELIVVDNASQDGSREWLQEQGDVRLIANEKNLGFPRACNQGLDAAKGEELLLLNSDTVVTAHWLENLHRALYSHEKVGAVSCLTNSCSNWQEIEVPYKADADAGEEALGGQLAAMQSFALGFNRSDPAKWERRTHLVGFCYLFRRALYERLGGLDERFSPGNYEDNDYSLRILEAGYELLLCKDTFIHHWGGASFKQADADGSEESRQKRAAWSKAMLDNRQRFYEKWAVSPKHRKQTPEEVRAQLTARAERARRWQEGGEALRHRVLVVIPVYREALTLTEAISLSQLRRTLGPYDKVFAAPEGLVPDYGLLSEGIGLEHFPAGYFASIEGYSRLLLSEMFYRRFRAYDYILIHQLDAFVFETGDRLLKFCEAGYDYWGAPTPRFDCSWHLIDARVGNGGLSLRRVSAALRVLAGQRKLLARHPLRELFLNMEDVFWGYCGRQPRIDFRVPGLREALGFAWQDDISHSLRQQEPELPLGLHAWHKVHGALWRLVLAGEYGYGELLEEDVALGNGDFRVFSLSCRLAARRKGMPLGKVFGAIRAGKPAQALRRLAAWQPGQIPEPDDRWPILLYLWEILLLAAAGAEGAGAGHWRKLAETAAGLLLALLSQGPTPDWVLRQLSAAIPALKQAGKAGTVLAEGLAPFSYKGPGTEKKG